MENCCICLEPVPLRTQGFISTCEHIFHYICIKKWSQITNLCPICKKEFNNIIKKNKKGIISRTIHIEKAIQKYKPDHTSQSIQSNLNLFSDIVCYLCGMGDNEEILLLCYKEECEISVHTYCIGLQEIPINPWFCPTCTNNNENTNQIDSSILIERPRTVASARLILNRPSIVSLQTNRRTRQHASRLRARLFPTIRRRNHNRIVLNNNNTFITNSLNISLTNTNFYNHYQARFRLEARRNDRIESLEERNAIEIYLNDSNNNNINNNNQLNESSVNNETIRMWQDLAKIQEENRLKLIEYEQSIATNEQEQEDNISSNTSSMDHNKDIITNNMPMISNKFSIFYYKWRTALQKDKSMYQAEGDIHGTLHLYIFISEISKMFYIKVNDNQNSDINDIHNFMNNIHCKVDLKHISMQIDFFSLIYESLEFCISIIHHHQIIVVLSMYMKMLLKLPENLSIFKEKKEEIVEMITAILSQDKINLPLQLKNLLRQVRNNWKIFIKNSNNTSKNKEETNAKKISNKSSNIPETSSLSNNEMIKLKKITAEYVKKKLNPLYYANRITKDNYKTLVQNVVIIFCMEETKFPKLIQNPSNLLSFMPSVSSSKLSEFSKNRVRQLMKQFWPKGTNETNDTSKENSRIFEL